MARWLRRLGDRLVSNQLCARPDHFFRPITADWVDLPPCAGCAADIVFAERLAMAPASDRVLRFKLRFNRRFRYDRLCLHGRCWRGETSNNRCHRHQERP